MRHDSNQELKPFENEPLIDVPTFLFSDIQAGLWFAFYVEIGGVKYRTGFGQSKKEARRQAAEQALEDLLPTLKQLSSDSEAAGKPSYLLDVYSADW